MGSSLKLEAIEADIVLDGLPREMEHCYGTVLGSIGDPSSNYDCLHLMSVPGLASLARPGQRL